MCQSPPEENKKIPGEHIQPSELLQRHPERSSKVATTRKRKPRLTKPQTIADNPYKSAKWDELTKSHEFNASQVPMLITLCQWYAVLDRCTSDLEKTGGAVSFINDYGDEKPVPQIGIMKQASAEIRALNKQLGILEEPAQETKETTNARKSKTKLEIIQGRRQRKAKAANR